MASSSSSSSSSSFAGIWRYRVFTSFRGPDVRKSFLSHLRKQFNGNGITIAPELTQGISETMISIRESRISIIVLSENYASSIWCLDELLEILKCKEEMGQIVMTIFYGVDPSDVRKQTGDFGRAFEKTCAGITEEKRPRWRQALTDVGNIIGENFLNWDNEAEMIEKVAKDVLDKLNATPSKDFDGMVGLEAHLKKMEFLLDLDSAGVKMVGIYGPVGIGKTTIARALHGLFSSRFQLTCFVDNLRESYHSGFDEYGLKLRLQEQFLSKVLNHNGMRISHLGAVKENLYDQKVLIILDDVNTLNQLEALANETTWFGPGSRIVVTTKNQELLQQHGIDNVYHVGSPSRQEALEILCRYAFRQSYPQNGFKELAGSVVELCGNLPMGLRVVGSSLRGKKEGEWAKLMRRLETIDSQDIEKVQRAINEPAPFNRPAGKSKSRYSTAMAFLVVINLLLEIASAVSDQLSSIRKPYFARIALVMSIISAILSILDLAYKIRVHKACFRCKWPIPWFYYPSRGYNRIFGSFTDTVLLFCVVGQLIVSTINCSYTERRRNGPIKVSVWPLFFAIGMVCSKFMEKTPISKEN